jgi:ATP-dependent Clp protease ATP-binding subunit ClpA
MRSLPARVLRLLRLEPPRVAKMQVDLRRLSADQQELRGPLIVNGYNFTERVRKVLAMAREEAARLHHEYVGTEHILLGVLREGEGVAATVIQNLGVDLNAIEDRIDEIVKRGNPSSTTGPDLPYTSRAKKVLELAMDQARHLDHRYVGTEHLLLGLVAERKGIAAQVLTDFGVTLEKAAEETLRILGTEVPPATPVEPTKTVFRRARWSNVAGMSVPGRPERVRIVFNAAQDVAAESGSDEFLPVHLAIALVQHGEGLANAVLDRLGCDRNSLLPALEGIAESKATPAEPEQVVKVGQEMIALEHQIHSQAEWAKAPLSTLHILLALLDTQPEIAAVFDVQGLSADRVRTEARRISG